MTLQIGRAAGPKRGPRNTGMWHRRVLPTRLFRHPAIAILATALALVAGTAQAETVAVLQGLDKTTARVSRFDAPLDKSVRFGTLVITARTCVKRPPEEPPESAAFLVIDEVRPGEAGTVISKRVFSGWMFASSPAVSALEDPIYDINVLDCKDAAPAAPSTPVPR